MRLANRGRDGSTGWLRAEVAEVARSLAGSDPNSVEQMLAEVASTAWLALRVQEENLARAQADGGCGLRTLDVMDRRLTHATRRLCSLLRTLTAVRKVVPQVQINVATNQQVNNQRLRGVKREV